MTGVFVSLTLWSIRNSVRLRIRRLRQPRYLVMGIGVLLYAASMMFGRTSRPLALFAIEGARAQIVAAGIATLLLATAWVLPVTTPLAFTSAEIQLLFPAPIPRRQLIAYKVWRLLLGTAAMGGFLALVVGPAGLVTGLRFALKATVLMAVLTLHGAGVAMFRGSVKDKGLLPVDRWPILAAALVLTPLAGAGLAFIAFASGVGALAAVPLGLLLLGANAAWIIRSDNAFEEAATKAAETARGAAAAGLFSSRPVARPRSTPFRLASHGPAETAILWKNWLLLGRMSRRLLIVAAIALGTAIAGFLAASEGDLAAATAGSLCLFFVALVVLLGPAMLRIDLRQDLGHLALIKTWPVRGAAIIRGEVLAPALALSLVATAAIVIGSAVAPALPFLDQPAGQTGPGTRALFAVAAAMAVTAVIVAQLVVHNGIAVSFPAWVDLKVTGGAAAMELNVRMMIVMYGALLILAFVLVVPAAAAAAAYFVAGGLIVPATIFAALLLGEALAATEVIGRIFERTDLQDVIVAE